MKLRLPALLAKLILFCMTSSSVTLASGNGPMQVETETEPGASPVLWKPVPVFARAEARERENTAKTEVSVGTEKNSDASEMLKRKDELVGMAETLSQNENPADEQDFSMPAEVTELPSANPTQAQLTGAATGSGRKGDGVHFVRVADGRGGERWLFVLGKGEEMEVDPDDNVWAFWNYPENYNHDFFENHWLYNGYSSVWVTAKHRVPLRYTPASSSVSASAPASTTTATWSGVPAPAPSFGGGFGGGGAVAGGGGGGRRPSVNRPDKPSKDDDALAEDKDDEKTDDEKKDDASLTNEGEDGGLLADQKQDDASLAEEENSPALFAASGESSNRFTRAAPAFTLFASRSMAAPRLASAPPVAAAAANTTLFTKPAENTTAANWTPKEGSTDVGSSSGNWDKTIATTGTIVFNCGGNVVTSGSFDVELLATNNNGANNTGIVVCNNTSVTMTDSKWLCMIQVAEGSSLDFTMSNDANFKTPTSLAGVANVVIEGALTIHHPGICLASAWYAHDQNWYIGANGALTLEGAMISSSDRSTSSNANGVNRTWYIQKQLTSTAESAQGTTVDILAITNSTGATGDSTVYNQLKHLYDKKLLDITVFDSTGQALDTKWSLTESGISAYVAYDLVWAGTEGATWQADGSGFYKNGDATQTVAIYHEGDKVTFNTENAQVNISGTVKPCVVNIEASTTFMGGTVNADTINLEADLTLNATQLVGNGRVNGSGTLSVFLATQGTDWQVSNTTFFAGFTGTIELHQGRLALGNSFGNRGGGIDASLGNSTLKVYNGASFQLGLGGNDKTFQSNVWTESGAQLYISDGHAVWSGEIHINELSAVDNATTQLEMAWGKVHNWSGLVSGRGTFKFTTKNWGSDVHRINLCNDSNTFAGTYELAGNDYQVLGISATHAAKDAKVLMTGSRNNATTGIGLAIACEQATIAGLASNGTGSYYVCGDSAGTHTLTIDSAADASFTGVFRDGTGTLALVKTGSGSQTLIGNNTATGSLSVTGGTLVLQGDNTKWASVVVGENGTLVLHTAGCIDFTKLNNGHLVLFGGEQELSSMPTTASGTGSFGVAEGARITLGANFSSESSFSVNKGTLILSEGSHVSLTGMDNASGTIIVANAQTINSAVAGTVQVGGTAAILTLADGGSLTGTLVLDLGEAAKRAGSFYADLGAHSVNNLSLSNYSDLAVGTYDLLRAADISPYLGTRLVDTAYKTFALGQNGNVLQLTVTNIAQQINTVTNIAQQINTDTTWTADQQVPADIPVVVGGGSTVTLKTGTNTENGTTHVNEVYTYGNITVENGSTLNVHLGSDAARTVLTNDKLVYGSRITLKNNATLKTEDGSYYFSKEIVVVGNDVRIINNWDKGIVYSSINGVNAETDKGRTLRFSPSLRSDNLNAQLITFAGAGNFGGTVVLNKTDHGYYVINHENAFQNALLELGDDARVGLNKGNVNLRGLKGSGKLYVAGDSAFFGDENRLTVEGTGVDANLAAVTLTITGNNENSSYTGTFGDRISLRVAEGASQTLSGTTCSLAGIVTNGELTLNGTSTVGGTVNVTSKGTLMLNNQLTAQAVSNSGVIVLGNAAAIDFSTLTNNGQVRIESADTTLGDITGYSGRGSLQVSAPNSHLTTTGDMANARISANRGTLTVGAGTSHLNLDGLDNTQGTVSIANTQSINGITGGRLMVANGGHLTVGGAVSADLSVEGNGQLSLLGSTNLSGSLTIDLTGATEDGGARLLLNGTVPAGLTSIELAGLSQALGTYTLADTGDANLVSAVEALVKLPASSPYAAYSLVSSGSLVQLQIIQQVPNYAGTIYTWRGTTDAADDLAYGTYNLTTYTGGQATVTDTVLSGWDPYVKGAIAEKDNPQVTLRLDGQVSANDRILTYNFGPLVLNGIIVTQGATGYEIKPTNMDGQEDCAIYLGSVDGATTTVTSIRENFKLSAGNNHSISIRGVENHIIVDPDKTFTLGSNTSFTGKALLYGGGTMTLEKNLALEGSIDIAKDSNLRVNGVVTTGDAASLVNAGTLTLIGGIDNFFKIRSTGTLELGFTTTLASDSLTGSSGRFRVLSGGHVTLAEGGTALDGMSYIGVASGATLAATQGFRQAVGQEIRVAGDLLLGGEVSLNRAIVALSSSATLTLSDGIVFDLTSWTGNPEGGSAYWNQFIESRTKTFSLFDLGAGVSGTLVNYDGISAGNFRLLGNVTADYSDIIRSISVDSRGLVSFTYWATDEQVLTGGTITLRDNDPYYLKVRQDTTVSLLTTQSTTDHGQVIFTPGEYSFLKGGEGTLIVEAVDSSEVDELAVTGGKLQLGVASDNAEESKTVVLNIGTSRITTTGGTLENVLIDTDAHSISRAHAGEKAKLTDVALRLGSSVTNGTTMSYITFAGNSSLSGFIDVLAGDANGMGNDISVEAGATLSIGTPSRSTLGFNFDRGILEDPGDGHTAAYTLIQTGEGATLKNWDKEHVRFYYEGVLACDVLSTGQDTAGVLVVDTSKAAELLWNGTASSWNPSDANSTAWYAGTSTHEPDEEDGWAISHDWDKTTGTRFLALSNAHFDTLTDEANQNLSFSISMNNKTITLMDFVVGTMMDDSKYGDGGLQTPIDAKYYNHSAYTFTDGTLRTLRDFYIRTDANIAFGSGVSIEAQDIFLYSRLNATRVNFNGGITARNLTIGHSGEANDCRGIYTFNGAVSLSGDMYAHIDYNVTGTEGGSEIDNVNQLTFNQTLTVAGKMTLSGVGSKVFNYGVTLTGTSGGEGAGDLLITSCQNAFDAAVAQNTTPPAPSTYFANSLSVAGNLLIKNNAHVAFKDTNSVIRGKVQMWYGELQFVSSGGAKYRNGGDGYAFELFDDHASLYMQSNSKATIREIASEAGKFHDFTINGSVREAAIGSLGGLKSLNIAGGTIAINGYANGGIHGDLTLGADAKVTLNGSSAFSTGEAEQHTLTLNGQLTLAAGTTQTLTGGSAINLNDVILYAGGTGDTLATINAQGDLTVNFNGTGAGVRSHITQEKSADESAPHVLTLRDQTEGKQSLLTLTGKVTGDKVLLTNGTKVYLGAGAELSGVVHIGNGAGDGTSPTLLTSLTVTEAGQVTDADITVRTGATLNVIAEETVTLAGLHLMGNATIALDKLTATDVKDPSTASLRITGTAERVTDGEFYLYIQDTLQTMRTYAIVTAEKGLSANLTSKVSIYTMGTDGQSVLMNPNQYELVVDENTLYLNTFFGLVWRGDAETGEGTWSISDENNYWSGSNFQDGQTAIFRDLVKDGESSAIASAKVTLSGDIKTDGIYVTSDSTGYTFVANETTLHGVGDNTWPLLSKAGASTLTLQDFSQETFDKISVAGGTLLLDNSQLTYTDSLILKGGTLKLAGKADAARVSSISYGESISITATDGTKETLLAGVVFEKATLTGAAEQSTTISNATISGYTVSNITLGNKSTVTMNNATMGSGVTVESGSALTLSGLTTFMEAVSNRGAVNIAAGASVDIGQLSYVLTPNVDGEFAKRDHTYTLFSQGEGATVTLTGEALDTSRIYVNGAQLSKYNSNYVSVQEGSLADGTIMLRFNGADAPKWDKAWGFDSTSQPWLGFLVEGTTDGEGHTTYTHYDNAGTGDSDATYLYSKLLAEGVTTNVAGDTVVLVLSRYLGVSQNDTFASGDGYYSDGTSIPRGDVWVFDNGSNFGTKISGYLRESNDTTFHLTDMVTHMVLNEQKANTDAAATGNTEAPVATNVVGGSVNVNMLRSTDTPGDTGTYLTINGGKYGEVVGGSKFDVSGGILEGDTHVYIHGGTIDTLYGGSYNGSAKNVHVTVDGGTIGTLYGGSRNASSESISLTLNNADAEVTTIAVSAVGDAGNNATTGKVDANLLAGTINSFVVGTKGTTDKVLGDVTVNLATTNTQASDASPAVKWKLNQSRLEAYAQGHTSTLNLVDDSVYNLSGINVNGFNVIDIGTKTAGNTVTFNVRNFMNEHTDSTQHEVSFSGSGKVIFMGGGKDNYAQGCYHLTLNKGIALWMDTSYITNQAYKSTYPLITVEDGATLEVTGRPLQSDEGGGLGFNLELSGHGVDNLGALFKASGDAAAAMTALPDITVKGNASIGGSGSICTDAHGYGQVNIRLQQGQGAHHTLTRQGGGSWLAINATFTGGTLNLTDTATVQVRRHNSLYSTADTTDVVIGEKATFVVMNEDGGSNTTNSFTMRSLSGLGTLKLNSSTLYLKNVAGVGNFYDEYLDSSQYFYNSEGYSHGVYGGYITNDGSMSGMLVIDGSGRQVLSGSSSDYAGTTRMNSGELRLLGTSEGTMDKNSSTVSRGVLGKSMLEWNGGRLVLGNNAHIYNSGYAMSGTETIGGLSRMEICVEAIATKVELPLKSNETKVVDGATYCRVDTSGTQVAKLDVDCIDADNKRYVAGTILPSGKIYYVLQLQGSTVKALPGGIAVVSSETLTINGEEYRMIDTSRATRLSVDCFDTEGTKYTAGTFLTGDRKYYVSLAAGTEVSYELGKMLLVTSDVVEINNIVYRRIDTSEMKTLTVDCVDINGKVVTAGTQLADGGTYYVKRAEGSVVLAEPGSSRYNEATYSGVLSDGAGGYAGRLVKTGLGTLTIDQYNSYTGGTEVLGGTLEVKGWGQLGDTSSTGATQKAGTSLMLSYDGSYYSGEEASKMESFFINTDINLVGTGDVRWTQEEISAGYTAALISNIGGDTNAAQNFTLGGALTGDGNLLHMGVGTLVISNWKEIAPNEWMYSTEVAENAYNTYTGGTTVTKGTVIVRKDEGLGTTADGKHANLITLAGSELRFESCDVTLAAVKDEANGYTGNDIRGKMTIGTENGYIYATGARKEGDVLVHTDATIEADPATVTVKGNGYWAEDTMLHEDGTLHFAGTASTNAPGAPGDPKALRLEGVGNLRLSNSDEAGAQHILFSDIGEGQSGFSGNIEVEGHETKLSFEKGDFDPTRNRSNVGGNITINGENAGIVGENSEFTITADRTLSLSSANDAWQSGNAGQDAGTGAAYLKAKNVTIAERGTLSVSLNEGAVAPPGAQQTLSELKRAASLNSVSEVAAFSLSDQEEAYSYHYVSAGNRETTADGKLIREAYTRHYMPETALNNKASGDVQTSGKLVLSAGSKYEENRSHVNLSGSALELGATADNKIDLYLITEGSVTWDEKGDSNQIVLFSGVKEFSLYTGDNLTTGEALSTYQAAVTNDSQADIYVFRAMDYFANCWQINAGSLLVYDSGAQVVYLDDVVPEPASGTLSVLALAALAARRRRRKKQEAGCTVPGM